METPAQEVKPAEMDPAVAAAIQEKLVKRFKKEAKIPEGGIKDFDKIVKRKK